MASSFNVGRVYLVGDAAHRHPPTGVLGLTSAIQDVHNLCWKLGAVLAGHAAPALLDSYEPERRCSLEVNARRSLENAINHFTIIGASGISHEQGEEENLASLRRLWSGRAGNAEHRSAILRLMRGQSMEFSELNVELGYRHESAAIVDDLVPARRRSTRSVCTSPRRSPARRCHTRGSTTTTAWRRPIKDLVAPDRFLLIAGEEGEAWCSAAQELADVTGLPLDAVRIGHLDGDLFDHRLMWQRNREIGPDGTILVRPDRYVAWRSMGAGADPAQEPADALGRILACLIDVHLTTA